MKLIVISLMLISYNLLSNGFTIAPDKVTEFSLNSDVGKNELNFISNAPLEDIYGNVSPDAISSNFKFNPNNFQSLSGYVSFQVAAMETGISKRDEHLRSGEWLNASKYPEIKFQVDSFSDIVLKDDGDERQKALAVVSGTYSMHGESKKISVPVEITYIKESEKSRKRASGDLIFIKGEFGVKLSDFNVKGAQGIVGKKVGEEIKVEFNLFYNSK